ncbi:CCL28 protein, partial [Heliornis fulica]|nr:CCL28 protein [Heliornis fulica]
LHIYLVSNTVITLLALFHGAFSCCTEISNGIPRRILQRVEKFEIQKADGLCHLEAIILHVKGRKFCVSPRVHQLVENWMKIKHKNLRNKPHDRKQRIIKFIKKKENKQ